MSQSGRKRKTAEVPQDQTSQQAPQPAPQQASQTAELLEAITQLKSVVDMCLVGINKLMTRVDSLGDETKRLQQNLKDNTEVMERKEARQPPVTDELTAAEQVCFDL